MKKGFTLIEIIITITIIIAVGVSTTFVIIKSTNNDELEIATKQILEAANLYVRTEKDDNGNEYATQVLSGAKGVQIPLSNLVNKGYIDENIAQTVYESKGNPSSDQDYYIMFLQGNGEEVNYCDDGSTVTIASWTMATGDDIYLCDYLTPVEKQINILEIGDSVKIKYSNLIPVSETKYIEIKKNYFSKISHFTKDENGIFVFYNENTENVYYFYRGAVNNNYVKLGEKNGQPLLWRIVWYRDDGRMKLALDDTIPVELTTSSGEKITLEDSTNVYKYDLNSGNDYIFIGDEIEYSEKIEETKISEHYYSYTTYKIKYRFNKMPDAFEKNTYNSTIENWYNSTNLNIYSFILSSQNFCTNDYYEKNNSGTTKTYYPSANFDCLKSTGSYKTTDNYYSSKIGFLNYGDVYMAGLYNNTNIINVHDENYLSSEKPYLLEDISKTVDKDGDKGLVDNYNSKYYVDNTGIISKRSYSQTREATYYLKGDNQSYSYEFHYTLLDENGDELIIEALNKGKSGLIIEKSYFSQLKPAIVLDLTDYKLSNAKGTIDDPYTIIENE